MRFVSVSGSPSVVDSLCFLLFVGAKAQARCSSHPPADIQTLPFFMRDLGCKILHGMVPCFFLHGRRPVLYISTRFWAGLGILLSTKSRSLLIIISTGYYGQIFYPSPSGTDFSWYGVNERVPCCFPEAINFSLILKQNQIRDLSEVFAIPILPMTFAFIREGLRKLINTLYSCRAWNMNGFLQGLLLHPQTLAELECLHL